MKAFRDSMFVLSAIPMICETAWVTLREVAWRSWSSLSVPAICPLNSAIRVSTSPVRPRTSRSLAMTPLSAAAPPSIEAMIWLID